MSNHLQSFNLSSPNQPSSNKNSQKPNFHTPIPHNFHPELLHLQKYLPIQTTFQFQRTLSTLPRAQRSQKIEVIKQSGTPQEISSLTFFLSHQTLTLIAQLQLLLDDPPSMKSKDQKIFRKSTQKQISQAQQCFDLMALQSMELLRQALNRQQMAYEDELSKCNSSQHPHEIPPKTGTDVQNLNSYTPKLNKRLFKKPLKFLGHPQSETSTRPTILPDKTLKTVSMKRPPDRTSRAASKRRPPPRPPDLLLMMRQYEPSLLVSISSTANSLESPTLLFQ